MWLCILCNLEENRTAVKYHLEMLLCVHFWKHSKTFENTQWRKVKQMQPVWLCIHSGRRFEEAFENTQWRKVKQMQPVWLCIFWGKQFEETFEETQWRKVKQMQPVWLCIFWSRQIEETFENAQWRKFKQMQPVWLVSYQAGDLRMYLRTHSGEKSFFLISLEAHQTYSVNLKTIAGQD